MAMLVPGDRVRYAERIPWRRDTAGVITSVLWRSADETYLIIRWDDKDVSCEVESALVPEVENTP